MHHEMVSDLNQPQSTLQSPSNMLLKNTKTAPRATFEML